ncbi:MAG: hypothetical protein EPN37_03910, partial [Chitinophagaceae bacterium]
MSELQTQAISECSGVPARQMQGRKLIKVLMETQQLKIYNGKIITPYRLIENGTVLVTGGTLTSVCEGNIKVDHAMEIDANGHYISPGFIDIHVHGGGG